MSFINNELNLLTDWFRANKLLLDESKTRLLVFRTSRKLRITATNIEQYQTYFNPSKDVHKSWY